MSDTPGQNRERQQRIAAVLGIEDFVAMFCTERVPGGFFTHGVPHPWIGSGWG